MHLLAPDASAALSRLEPWTLAGFCVLGALHALANAILRKLM